MPLTTHSPTTALRSDRTVALLARLDLFDGLPDDELELLGLTFERISVQPGQVLEAQDAPVRRWSLIADGHAVVERDATPIGLLGRGESWNEHSLLNGLRSSISVAAFSPLTLLTLSERQFFSIPEHHPVLAGRLLARSATSADRMALPVYRALRHLTGEPA